MNLEKINVCFHIGRGGNTDHDYKRFVPEIETLQECFEDAIVRSEDEDGNPLPDEEWQVVDNGGNIVLSGREKIISHTGILDWDGDYNTDIVKKITDCTKDEYKLIIKAFEDGEGVEDKIISFACTQLGYYVALNIHSDNDAITIHTNYGDVSLPYKREDGDDWCEEYVWQELEPYDFISSSVHAVIDEMLECGWM